MFLCPQTCAGSRQKHPDSSEDVEKVSQSKAGGLVAFS